MPASTAPAAPPLTTASTSVSSSPHSHKLSSTAILNDNSHESIKDVSYSSPDKDHELSCSTQPNSNNDDDNNASNNVFMPEGLPLSEVCAVANTRVQQFLDERTQDERLQGVQGQVRKSLDIIEEALERYSLPELSLSYNGGKDCLVLLILYLCAVHRKGALLSQSRQQQQRRRRSPPRPQSQTQHQCQQHNIPSTTNSNNNIPSSTSSPITHLQSVYIQATHPFPAVEHFVTHSSAIYNLDLTRLRPPMKSAFATYLASFSSSSSSSSSSRPTRTLSAIFVGTRRTDPHGSDLKPFQRTDHGWPDFERIHPVLDWRYVEIWTFIRHLNIRYCPLYDAGYTSLGGTNDTYPNPALRINHPRNSEGSEAPKGPEDTEGPEGVESSESPESPEDLERLEDPESSPYEYDERNHYNYDLNSNANSKTDHTSALPLPYIQNGSKNRDPYTHTYSYSYTYTCTYKPAYVLQDDALERLGRDTKR